MKLPIKITDILIVLVAAGFTFLSAYSVYVKPQGKAHIYIKGQASEWAFPVNAEETVHVPGPLGNTVIRIHDNQTWVESSPCENQNCVVTGLLTRYGQWAACLPNNVLLIIHGVNDDDVDAVVW